MQYHLFQMHVSDKLYAEINTYGWGHSDLTSAVARLKMGSFGGDANEVHSVEEAIRTLADANLFVHSATILADRLQDVFQIGNVGPEELIMRTDAPMHSVSVGDVVIDPENRIWLCDNEGWTELYPGTMEAVLASAKTYTDNTDTAETAEIKEGEPA